MNLRTSSTNRVLAIAVVLCGMTAAAPGQATNSHRFSGIVALPDHTISLTVTSSVPTSWRNYYDLFPLETSPNLTDWEPLVTLLRTNRSTNATLFFDLASTNHALRFYRTVTNQLTTPLLPPDGPYQVGIFSRLLTDPSRTNRYVATNSSFMVSVWYPAEAVAGVLPAFHSDPKLGSIGYCTSRSPTGLRSHSLPGVPMSQTELKFPVVFYSHGDELTRTDNTRRVENFVSFGFIVVAIDHWNCSATVFSDGRRLTGLPIPNLGVGDPLTMQVATNRAQDMRFLLGELARWNSKDPMLQGRLDLERIGIFGLSFGGGTTAHACREEPLIKAGVSVDGGYEQFPIPAVERPFMILSGGDNDAYMQQFRDAFRNLFDRLTADAYWVHLTNSTHCDFNDTPWFDSPISTTRMRRALVQDLYVVSFFRKYLRAEDDHFLDAAPATWPEVDQLLKK